MGDSDIAGSVGGGLTALDVFFANRCVDAIELDSDEKLRQAETAWQRARGKITSTDVKGVLPDNS